MTKLTQSVTQVLLLHQLIWKTDGKRNKSKPPIAVPDTISVRPKSMSHLNVLDNDTDPNGDELYISTVTKAKNGYVGILDGNKEILYVPDSDFEGVDSFEYTVCDTSDLCSTAKVDVMVGSTVQVGTNTFRCNTSTRNTVNFGYYQSWAVYRSSDCNPMGPGDIRVDEFGYTHLAFSFAGISSTGKLIPYNGNTEFISMFEDFNALKTSYPELKTLIAVGGWSFQQMVFVEIAASKVKREYFAKSVVGFLETYGFDGIDLDWEYPVTRQGTPDDYENYPLLCEAIRNAFREAGHPEWLITVATAINPDKIKKGFNMAAMHPHIDWFNMMAYDIHGSWDSHAGANTDMQYITTTIDFVVSELRIPRDKLVLGLASYGRSSNLVDKNCVNNDGSRVGCEISGAGRTGCHGEIGNLPYFEIQELVESGFYDSLTINTKTGSVEMIDGRSFTSYDSPETFNIKYRYSFDQCLRGIMWWAVDLITKPVDFYEAHPSATPSLSIVPTTTTKSPTPYPTNLPTLSPTKTPPCGVSCPDGALGLLPMLDCIGYYSCKTGEPTNLTPCPPGTIFDQNLQTCNWSWATSCSCTKDTVDDSTPSSSTKTPRPSPLPKKICSTELQNSVNFGYYQSWASFRQCNSVKPGAIEVGAFGYTHLAFSFAGISSGGELEPYDGDSNFIPMYRDFNSLKLRNPELKTLIAVGGWTFPQEKFVSVSSNERRRSYFAKSVVKFLLAYGFDGIDLDWEYPVTRQGTPDDYENYPLLCEAIRNAFREAGHPEWLITVATAINPDKIKKGFNMAAMHPHIDWFNMMAYDIHGSWDSFAGANADMQYIKNTMHYVFGLDIPREKLVLGLAGYGRSMMLSDPKCTTDGCPITGAGLGGCHGEAGNIPFFEIDEKFIQTGDYDSLILNETTASMELITHGGLYFTSYDSSESLGIKYRYSFHECLRGIMWWAVDLIKEPIDLYGEFKPSVSPSVSVAPSTETHHPSISPSASPTVRCGSQCPPGATGFFSTLDCTGYYECRDGVLAGSIVTCPGGLVFNEKHQGCDWSYNTDCTCTSQSATLSPTTAQPSKKPVSVNPTKKPVSEKPTLSSLNTQMVQQSSSTNNPPNDETEREYYPDYEKNVCRNNGQAPAFEVNFFSSYEACCEFAWMDTESCLANKPGSGQWYPVVGGYCMNDGKPPKNVALSETYAECCTRFFPYFHDCIDKSNTQISPFMESLSDVCPTLKKKRPCKQNSICAWDEATSTCSRNSDIKSDECTALNKRKCKQQNSCSWDEVAEVCSAAKVTYATSPPTKKLTLRPTKRQTIIVSDTRVPCQSLKNKRQCKQDKTCSWNDATSVCSEQSSSITSQPNTKPSPRPTNQSIVSNTPLSCQSLMNKRKCKQNSSCYWNEDGASGRCEDQSDENMRPNSSATSCSSGYCFDLNGNCQPEYNCFADPCDSKSCNANKVCESNFCGGCTATCVENTLVQQSASVARPPTPKPSSKPTTRPSKKPIQPDTKPPSSKPSSEPTARPSKKPIQPDTNPPSSKPSSKPTARPSKRPIQPDTNPPTFKPSSKPTARPSKRPIQPDSKPTKPSGSLSSSAVEVETILERSKNGIDNNILLYQNPSNEWEPSTVYRYTDFIEALRVMYTDGVANKYFYMGDGTTNGYKYGLVNIAAFLAQSMKETIRYNACDENSWDLVNGVYPVSNACGQLGQSYQDYKCHGSEAHMQCEVDPTMKITATTNSKWWGAPAPLFCGPKSEYPFTGYWDYQTICHDPWASPPKYCKDYEGQKAGGFNHDSPVANSAGRTDVEGCCFWGRGVIQTTGVCNFGKLNYYLGARAAADGRPSRYPDINFCTHPDAICSSEDHKELKWIAGMFYWVESLQSYSSSGWDYITELHKWVDNGMMGSTFIDAVSGIVNRGCHNPPCASGAVDGQFERATNFLKVLKEFGL